MSRVIEIGSKQYHTDAAEVASFRSMIDAEQYIGVDLEAGDGVDIVADANDANGLPEGNADLVICCSILEHTPTPWKVAQNVSALVKPQGAIYVTVPWVWKYHPYPDDYFRISFNGIRSLFPSFRWLDQSYGGLEIGKFWKAINGNDNALAHMIGPQKYLPYLDVFSFGVKQ